MAWWAWASQSNPSEKRSDGSRGIASSCRVVACALSSDCLCCTCVRACACVHVCARCTDCARRLDARLPASFPLALPLLRHAQLAPQPRDRLPATPRSSIQYSSTVRETSHSTRRTTCTHNRISDAAVSTVQRSDLSRDTQTSRPTTCTHNQMSRALSLGAAFTSRDVSGRSNDRMWISQRPLIKKKRWFVTM